MEFSLETIFAPFVDDNDVEFELELNLVFLREEWTQGWAEAFRRHRKVRGALQPLGKAPAANGGAVFGGKRHLVATLSRDARYAQNMKVQPGLVAHVRLHSDVQPVLDLRNIEALGLDLEHGVGRHRRIQGVDG